MYDLIIVGAGPAGLTAAIYAARKKINFLLLSEDIGGEPNKTSIVENYPGFALIEGPELVKKWENHLKSLDPEIKNEKVIKIEDLKTSVKITTQHNLYEAKKVILSLGSVYRQLGVPGEKEFKGKGVSYCSTCDAPLFSGKDVAVAGGGNSALETVLDLEKYAKKIYLINNLDIFRCDRIFLDRIKKSPKIEILNKAEIIEIKGSNLIEKITITQDGQKKELEVQGVFVNIGYLPNTELVKDILRLNQSGEIEIDQNNKTSSNNIFAAGDCSSVKFKQIIISAGEGAKALLSALEEI